MNVEAENLNSRDTKIIQIEMIDCAYKYLFHGCGHLNLEQKISRYLAIKEKLEIAFKASD